MHGRRRKKKNEKERKRKNNAKFSGHYVRPRTHNVRVHSLRSHQCNVEYVDKMDNIGRPKRQPKRPPKKQPKSQSTFLNKPILDKTILNKTS